MEDIRGSYDSDIKFPKETKVPITELIKNGEHVKFKNVDRSDPKIIKRIKDVLNKADRQSRIDLMEQHEPFYFNR